jgi:hypothetical protein
MSDDIILSEDFDIKNITYGEPRVLESGGRSIPVYYNKRPLQVQMPEMSMPFGLGQWPKAKDVIEGMLVKYDISLSFRNIEQRDSLKAAYKMFTELDTAFVEKGLTDSFALFKKKYPNIDAVKTHYTDTIKLAKDSKTGEVTDKYPSTVNFKLPIRDNVFQFMCFNKQQEQIDMRTMQLKGGKAMIIAQCSGIWVANNNFGCSWKVKQIQVTPPTTITGYAFRQVVEECVDDIDDDQDMQPIAVKPSSAAAAAASFAATSSTTAPADKPAVVALIDESEEEKEEDEEDDEEEEPVVVPAKKATVKKVVKK